jgi:hypothetical protein
MNINLVLTTGLGYTILGGVILFLSHRSLYVKATRIVAGYPKVLAALRAQRHDGRFGLVVLVCGNVLQVLAALGYTVSIEHWRVPVYGVLGAIFVYCIWRVFAARRGARRPAYGDSRSAVRRVYETRRSMVLLEAARREAATRRARELADGPSNKRVVYVGQDWECRWWSERFGVSPQTLKAAVREVGPMVKDIERHFGLKTSRGRYAAAA